MSQKRKNQRAQHDAAEKAKAEKVIKWICAVLAVLAVALFVAYTMTL